MKLFDVYPLFDIEPIRGNGSYVYDKNGQKYLDFYGGHAVISIGHAHPHYTKKITKQVSQLGFYSNSIQNSLQKELASKLGELSGLADYQLFLCNSGAEANENALKLASFYNQQTKIIAFEKGFHGRTSAAVNITDNPKIKAPINTRFEVELHKWNTLDTIKKSLEKGDVCAVIIEGIQGIGGIKVPNPSFLEALQSLCHQYNTLLILDEIQSGYGRSGKFFAFQYANIQPDLITVAKGMGNGFPIGGVLIHPKFQSSYGLLGTTFGGNHLACAAGIAVLDVIKNENLIHHANTMGSYLKESLSELPIIQEVRGKGLMIGLVFNFPVAQLRKTLLYQYQTFTGSSSDKNVIRLLPPLTISKKEVDAFIQTLHTALTQNVTAEYA